MTEIKTLSSVNRNLKMYLKQIYPDPLIGLKKYAEATTGIGAGLDNNGFPVTGLTENFKDEKGKEVQGTREALEKELDLPAGTLKHTNVNYWASYFVRVGSDPVELNLHDPIDLQKYLFAHAQSIVAIGQKDIKSNSKHEFVLFSEEQEAAIKVAGRQALKTAYRLSDQLDLETKINILAVYGEIADSSAPNSIIDKVDEKIEENPEKFLKIAQDENLISLSLIRKCLDKGILSTKDGAIYYNEVIVGYTPEKAAEAVTKDHTLSAILKAELSGDMELLAKVLSKEKVK